MTLLRQLKPALFFFIFLNTLSELHAQKISINTGVDTIDIEKREVIKLWTNYLLSSPDSLYNNVLWNKQEKNILKKYDLLNTGGIISPSLYYFKNWDKKILSVTQLGEYYKLSSMFSTSKNVYAITNILAKKENNNYFLFNYLPYYTSTWHTQTVGLIKYHYWSEHKFDKEKAKTANEFLISICNLINFNTDTINYFIAPNCDEIYRMRGFEYAIGMGNNSQCGFFDNDNNIIYATTKAGENHQHELCHIINKHFLNAHELLLSGIAAYFGGENAHRSKPLIYHIKRVNNYLSVHSEIDLNDPTKFWQLDSETNPQYVIGALLCGRALDVGGIELLKKILNSGRKDENLINVIEVELKIPRTELNSYLRNRIAELASQNYFESYQIIKKH